LKILFLLLAAAALTPPDFNQPRVFEVTKPQGGSNNITVVTWNVDRGTNLPAITEGLKGNAADLVLLQEVDSNTSRSGGKDETADLAKSLNKNGVYAVEFEELSQEKDKERPAYIGQATLTSLPVRNSRVLRFQHQSGFWQPKGWLPSSLPLMQRRMGSRIALVTEFTFANKLAVVYNAHLESRNYGRLQAQQIDEIFADSARYPEKTPIIVAGDLNTKYFPSVFLRKFQRAGYISAMGNRTPITHNIPASLDWIFVKGPVTVSAGQVRKNLKGSDHYAVYAVIGAK
jgi:endonuclease/exonuclease/phosphatase family metal-dependent hydrolase